MTYDLSEVQIDQMKHALGFRKDRIKKGKHLKYEAFRNHYSSRKGCDGFAELKDLAYEGLMIHSRNDALDCDIFHVSEKGMEYLSSITGVEISEID